MNESDETGLFDTTDGDRVPPVRPQRIGRYRVDGILGQGGSGVVYLARDEQLHRFVAIKVPHPALVSLAEHTAAYLNEARTVAGLDHPNIVPVHDVGSTEGFPCFVVSKYIEGSTLERRIREDRPSIAESVALVTTVAETLQYAHSKGVVHRDVKPGNILLDTEGTPHVADFGLAMRDEDIGEGPLILGTPSYMSPEQARGEGHRVDGRSDIFSLAVVLYELLTGHRPFRGPNRDELLRQIATHDPRPPRQWNDKIPKELERTCLKALSKRASSRYTTARDFADDLRLSLQTSASAEDSGRAGQQSRDRLMPSFPSPAAGQSPIVPRGLSAFDEADGDFFLDLLPGPRDRNGLPDSIRFWKTRIEDRAPMRAMTVGLLYGSSGCGKSSLIRAGLLPRLSEHVITVYVEATPDETELRLLHGLRLHCPEASTEWSLKETTAALRRGSALPEGKKVLIILDQFEQWLHARNEVGAELTQALRQCDGQNLQCLILVRDDFYMAVNRFFQQLEVPIQEGHNSALVDLFDLHHARHLLIAFGRAYGRLPESTADLTADQSAFLDRAVAGLAQNGKVTGIRLSLFALMMKGLSWSPESLQTIGGPEGAGFTFLEVTFSSATAPPTHRLHQRAARDVLRALLPEGGTNIKGQMQPVEKLLEVSGYRSSPGEFDDLLRILVGEVRLISPTDPEGNDDAVRTEGAVRRENDRAADSLAKPISSSRRYYQLTHDFLVPAVREWLNRKQKETPSGRAELLLAERAAFWSAKQESKQLPTLLEWLAIVFRTKRSRWTETQRKMMRVVSRRHLARIVAGAFALFAVAILAFGMYGLWQRHRQEELAGHLVDRLIDGDVTNVAAMADQLARLPGESRARLLRIANDDLALPRARLRAHLAIVRDNRQSVAFLVHQFLKGAPDEFAVILKALRPQRLWACEALWPIATGQKLDIATDHKQKVDPRFLAAAGLAELNPENVKWPEIAEATARSLVRVDLLSATEWTARFRAVRKALLDHLMTEFSASNTAETQRTLTASILADYAADDPAALARLLQRADTVQFPILFPAVKAQREACVEIFQAMLAATPKSIDDDVRARTRRHANCAVALLLLDQPEAVETFLGQNDDPDARTALIDLLPSLVEVDVLWSLYQKSIDSLARQAILLAVDAYPTTGKLTPLERAQLDTQVSEIMVQDDSAAVHSAAEWLLSRLTTTDRVEALIGQLAGKKHTGWRVSSTGHTLALIQGPVSFQIGSPRDEDRRDGGEDRAPRRIAYSYEIGTHEITVAQFLKFFPDHKYGGDVAPSADCPMNYVSWYDVAKYCSRLDEAENVPENERIFPRADDIHPDRELVLPENWLKRSGYRWPTEAEWEYACRAGTTTSRFFGSIVDALAKYGCWNNADERCLRVGSLRPNQFGLFDVLGNVGEWCFDPRLDYSLAPATDQESARIIRVGTHRVFRGGSFKQMSKDLRSAKRDSSNPGVPYSHNGFRIARTVSADSTLPTLKKETPP